MEVIWDTVIEEILGDTTLKSLTIKNVKTGELSELEVDGLFVSIGTIPNSDLVKDLLELNKWREIVVGKKMETSLPGLYAAGDVTDACPEQVATAVGTGVAAAIAIDEYLQSIA